MRAMKESSAALFIAKWESRKTLVRAAGTSQRASTDQINRVGVVSYQLEADNVDADNAAHTLISVLPVD